MRVMEWLTLFIFAHFEGTYLLLLSNITRLSLKGDLSWSFQILFNCGHVEMNELGSVELSERLKISRYVFIVSPINHGITPILTRLQFLLYRYPSTKGTRRWHAIETCLYDLSIHDFFGSSTLLKHLNLVLDNSSGNFAHNRLGPLKLAILELVVVEHSLLHLSQVKVVYT